jgi:hypothetical protein
MAPDIRVLFEFTDSGMPGGDYYCFLALSDGLGDLQASREYGATHFGDIQCPELKVCWALILFYHDAATTEVVRFLHATLRTPALREWLQVAMSEQGFADFEKKFLARYPER